MLDPSFYQKYGGVSGYLKQQRNIRQMGTNPTQYQKLARYRSIQEQKNPTKKISDFFRVGGNYGI